MAKHVENPGTSSVPPPAPATAPPVDHGGQAPVRDHDPDRVRDQDRAVVGEARARDKFGGLNPGAAFFGWIVAIERGATIRTYETAQAATAAAEKARKDKANEIEKTPAADLVDSSPRADELKRARDEASNGLADAVRARAREILQRGGSGAAP